MTEIIQKQKEKCESLEIWRLEIPGPGDLRGKGKEKTKKPDKKLQILPKMS